MQHLIITDISYRFLSAFNLPKYTSFKADYLLSSTKTYRHIYLVNKYLGLYVGTLGKHQCVHSWIIMMKSVLQFMKIRLHAETDYNCFSIVYLKWGNEK